MATPITVTISNLNVGQGDHFFPTGGVTIPAGYTNLHMELDTSNWLPTDNIFVFIQYSMDGGTTWADEGGIETDGGPHFARDGVTPALPNFNAQVPQGVGVKARVHYIVPSTQQVPSGAITLT